MGGWFKGINTIAFIHKHEVPKNRMKDITYGQFTCNERPEKAEVNRTRFTVVWDKINYPRAVATLTAEMLVAKILFNNDISTKHPKFMTINISNFYLNSPLPHSEYIKIKINNISEEVIKEYKLRDKVTLNDYVYIMATKCMYGLPQAGLIANKLLEEQLNKHGYQ